MIILDENIVASQRDLLVRWNVRFRQIGKEIGESGMSDDQILQLLLKLRQPTSFTRDRDFDEPALVHSRYCLVFLKVDSEDMAAFIWRFLRHPEFTTKRQRMGSLARVTDREILRWRRNQRVADHLRWNTA